jgi:DNA (cytosine-5)-methyltransferase 1
MRGRPDGNGRNRQQFEVSDRTEANAITTVQKDSLVGEPVALDKQNGYIRKDGCVGTITTDGSSPKHNNRIITSNDDTSHLRIRKLTPKECFRLMGFDDADFEKAESVNSNTQLYKQAGNSIVVDVLEHLWRKIIDSGAFNGRA